MNTQTNEVAAAVTPAAKVSRTQAFKRDFSKGTFDGPLSLTPSDDLAKLGVKPLVYNLAEVPGFSTLPKGARVIFLRGVADQVTQTFAAVLRGTKEDGEGTIPEAIDEMNDVIASIVEGTFTYGRAGTAAGRTQGVALTAALLVAVQYQLATREEAIAHPHYTAVKEHLQEMLTKAEAFADAADAVEVGEVIKAAEGAELDADAVAHNEAVAAAKLEQDTAAANATAIRSAYMQIAKEKNVAAKRVEWYPPKVKEVAAPVATAASIFASLTPAA